MIKTVLVESKIEVKMETRITNLSGFSMRSLYFTVKTLKFSSAQHFEQFCKQSQAQYLARILNANCIFLTTKNVFVY